MKIYKQKKYFSQSNRLVWGFTLIEILLSIAVIAILVGVMAPVTLSVLSRTNLSEAADRVADTLRTAELNARTGKNDMAWGVHYVAPTITLFAGDSYGARVVDLDQVDAVNDPIQMTGLTEIIFSKNTAVPSTTGEIVLSSPVGTETITVNEKGLVAH